MFFHVSANGVLIAAAPSPLTVVPTKSLQLSCFIGSAWPNCLHFIVLFKKIPTKKFLRSRRCAIHAQFVAASCWDFHVFMIPRHNGDRARPSPGAPFHAPRAPLPPGLIFEVPYLPLLLYHVSLAGRVLYGVAATLASVISEHRAAVARWKGVPGLGR